MILQGGHKLVHISMLQGDDKAGPEAQLKSKANYKICTYILIVIYLNINFKC